MGWLAFLQGGYQRLRLQTRFALHIILLVAAIFAVLIPAVLMIQESAILGTARDNGLRLVTIFAFSSVPALVADDFLGLRQVVNSLGQERDVRYAMILDLQGRVLIHTLVRETGAVYHDRLTRHALAATAPVYEEVRTPQGEILYDFATPVLILNQRRAVARIGISMADEVGLIRRTRNTILGLGVLTLISGLLYAHFQTRRLTRPIQALAQGAQALALGELSHRIRLDREDEVGHLAEAFNRMADQLRQSREKLIQMTRLESWQALARKMAHEVKNSLTPIRLTMEEISARSTGPDAEFLRQAAQIVVDEVVSLEKRVRAFSQFAAEPPVCPERLDMNALVEDRVSFLRAAHPEVSYSLDLAPGPLVAVADPDLVKGVVTNLLQNAAEAARSGGEVLLKTVAHGRKVLIEVHDSGPGLSPEARGTVFEPTISFKKGGMGLGLSIARKSAVLCGGDIAVIEGQLGGAGFRVSLPAAVEDARAAAQPTPAAVLTR